MMCKQYLANHLIAILILAFIQFLLFGAPTANSAEIIGSVDTPGNPREVVISGTMAYVADGDAGLQIINIYNLTAPFIIGSLGTLSNASDIAISGTTAYVVDYWNSLEVINVSNPTAPTIVGSVATPGYIYAVAISGTLAYVADGRHGLQVIDVSNPATPTIIGSADTPGQAIEIAVSGSMAYVVDWDGGLQIINVSNPTAPAIIGSLVTPSEAVEVTISGSMAYVADYQGRLHIVNVSNPAAPTIIGSVDTPDYIWDISVSGSTAYVADGFGDLQIIDVSNPTAPAIIESVYTQGQDLSVAISGTTAYVTTSEAGLQIINLLSNECPMISVIRSNITVTQGDSVSISWDGADPDDDALVYLYADTDTNSGNGTAYTIAMGLSEDGSYTWSTSGVAAGSYYIAGLIDDGECTGNDYSSGRVTITVNESNTCPIISVNRSDISVKQGDPVSISWDGADPDDDAVVALYADTDTNYGNGIAYTIAMGRSEDGSYTWSTSGVAAGSYYIAGLIDDGECTGNDYSSGRVTITVNESNTCPTISVNRIDISVTQGDPVSISWDGADPDDEALVALYADSDTNYGNGIAYTIAMGRSEDGSYTWSTSGVAAGSYYIAGLIDDGECTGNDYSSGRVTITTGSSCPVITPTQLTPTAGAKIDGSSVTMDWSDGGGSQWDLHVQSINGGSIFSGIVTTSSDFSINGLAEGRYRWRVSAGNGDCVSDWTAWRAFTIGNPETPWQNLNGFIRHNGGPVCAMLLANGQYQFSCSGDGSFDLDVPLDNNHEITIQAFCSGKAPYREVIAHDQASGLYIDLSNPEDDKTLEVYPLAILESPGRCEISGSVKYENLPVCAMALANGQYMFTCSGDGSFDLEVPVDGNGEVTLYVFCSGFQPYKRVFEDFPPPEEDGDGDGYTVGEGDCNDSNASIHPGAEEICGDNIDQDCNGSDLNCSSVDADGDGFNVDVDCNDNVASIYPGAIEICGDEIDQDCDGEDLDCSTVDADGDGYSVDVDCNDNDSSIYPGAPVIYGDNIDQDCDGIDEIEVNP